MDKEELINKRGIFFENILKQMRLPISRMDKILEQDKYYTIIDEDNTFFDAQAGDLAIYIAGEFFNKKFNVCYSFWQVGEKLKIGIAIYDIELQAALATDAHNEINDLWGNNTPPNIDASHNFIYYDWEFDVPKLYENYLNQEKYILGTRHMHFRVMRIFHDECHKLYLEKNSNTKEDKLI